MVKPKPDSHCISAEMQHTYGALCRSSPVHTQDDHQALELDTSLDVFEIPVRRTLRHPGQARFVA